MDTESEINKVRWERWRAEQNMEREKSYCYHGWGGDGWSCDWSDVPPEPEDHFEWEWDTWSSAAQCFIYASASFGYFAPSEIDHPDHGTLWLYPFRIAGLGATRDQYGNPANYCHSLAAEFKETGDHPEYSSLWVTTSSAYIGAWPKTGQNPNYTECYTKIIEFALSKLNPVVSFALSVEGLLEALRNAYDDSQLEPGDPEDVYFRWNFCNPPDCAHVYWLDVKILPEKTVNFEATDYFEGGLLEPGWITWHIEITAPPPTKGMSAAEREKYGIEEIPISEFKKRAIWYSLRSDLKEILEKEKMVCIANKFSVKVTMHSTKPRVPNEEKGKNE